MAAEVRLQRIGLPPRPNAQARLEDVGVSWHGLNDPEPYWEERAYYRLSSAQAGRLEAVGQNLTELALAAADYVITEGRLGELGIPEWLHDAVKASWDRDDPSVYMRLDLAWDGAGDPKLLEINGQTPTSLLEASVAQWQWLEDRRARGELEARCGQWNTIHEALTEQWQYVVGRGVTEAHFASAGEVEDVATTTYLRSVAQEAGLRSQWLAADRVGTSPDMDKLADEWSMPINTLCWLWPFEFAWESRDARFLATTATRFIEPLWKAVLASKGLLAIMHELNPDHPNILGAQIKGELSVARLGAQRVTKPMYSREGQNVTLPGQESTEGAYGDLKLIEQAYTELPEYPTESGPRYPIMGVWIAGGDVCGLGIREGRSRVTDNRASFIPHVVEP